jgi:ribosome biogenesis protein BRX1
MMPHTKTDSKMQKKESLFAVNEIAEMKNCEKCLLFEGRKKKDIYMWAANVARGPSVKFEVRFRILHYTWGNAWLAW